MGGYRARTLLLGGIIFSLAMADGVCAQQASPWPEYPLQGHQLSRGSGGYLSAVKIGFCIVLFFAWVRSADWVNRDCRFARMQDAIWNPVVVFPFVLAVLLAWTIPYFLVGTLLLVGAVAAPLGIYVWQRNGRVNPSERVLTPDHFRRLFRAKTKGRVAADAGQPQIPRDKGPLVGLIAMGAANELDNKANLAAAQESPGFLAARGLLDDALSRRTDKIMLDYTQQTVAVRYQVDGFWHEVESQDRETGDFMLAVMKKVSALNMDERRTRQNGTFGVLREKTSYTCSLTSQGTKTGERVVLHLDDGVEEKFTSLEQLGMRSKTQEQLTELLSAEQGMILLASLPGDGLTTTLNLTLKSMDRFMRNFVSVEDHGKREVQVENVEVMTFDTAAGGSPAGILDNVVLTDPEVIIMPDLPDGASVDILTEQATGGKLVVATVRAKEAVEALLRVLLLKANPESFASAVTAVVNQRLVRQLCSSCKEAYVPAPELLKKLGLPAGRVEALYREPQQRSAEEGICDVCGGIGYHSRTAIFELLMVNDQIREALTKQPKLEVLRGIARKSGIRTLQEEGIVLVARGATALPELMRVLKQ